MADVTLGQLAKLTGKSPNTLLRQEELGNIPASYRDGKGWRRWTQDDVTKAIRYFSRG